MLTDKQIAVIDYIDYRLVSAHCWGPVLLPLTDATLAPKSEASEERQVVRWVVLVREAGYLLQLLVAYQW